MTEHTESSHRIETGSIVVGVDGSDASHEALQWAAEEARLSGLPLVAVIVWEWPTTYGSFAGWPEDLDLQADAHQLLDESIEKVFGPDGAKLTKLVIEGHPALILTDLSKDASLVVVGSRGHGEFAGMLLGSVSQFLATHAHCPVVIMRRH